MRQLMKLFVGTTAALAIICGIGIKPSFAAPEVATKADIKRLDHEIEMLKLKLGQLEATMNQHSKPGGMGMGQHGMMGKPGMGMQGQGMGNQQQGMPMMDDDNMEMPMGNAQPQGGNMPSGGMGDM